MERRGRVIRVIPTLVNRQREEPTGCDGERQLSMNGTSRVSREAQARICERLGVRFPGATRREGVIPSRYSPLHLNSPSVNTAALELTFMESNRARPLNIAGQILINRGARAQIAEGAA